jgi:TetR/AcrR family transcriptional regulator
MKEKQTERRIKDTAKRIFFGKGRFNAKLHEIAKEAGLNRALLHYYFRNRENLFEVVLKEAIDDSFLKMFAILSTDKPFEEKVEEAIHHIVDSLAEFPFMENFIISEINKNPGNAGIVSPVAPGKTFTKQFLKEVKGYFRKNKLPSIPPEQFIVNMMALCAYPSSTKPIIQGILGYNEKTYTAFLKSRKKILPGIILMKSIPGNRNSKAGL